VFKIIIYAFIALIAIVLAMAATKPDSFQVQRSVSIDASPQSVVGLIDDFHNWGSWSPWEKLDPSMKKTFTGASSGQGSVYAWEGNSKVGAGRMEILDVTPAKVTIKLDFIRPFEGHNIAEFELSPKGPTTQVTWAMHGPTPFVSKILQVFVSMDTLIGGDFAQGLANLKAVAERSK
jgi:Polyketide cyclase / dehydrase and lipid transport